MSDAPWLFDVFSTYPYDAVDESNEFAQLALYVITHALLNTRQTYSMSDTRGSVTREMDE